MYQIHPFCAEVDIWPVFCFISLFFRCSQEFFVALLSRGMKIYPLSAIFKFLNVYYFLVTGWFLRQAWSIKVNKCLSITFAVNILAVKFVIILLSKDLWPWCYNTYHENCMPPRYTPDQKLSIRLRHSPIFKEAYLTYC